MRPEVKDTEATVPSYSYPSNTNAKLLPNELHAQFVLSSKHAALPTDWPQRRLGALWLSFHKKLAVVNISCDHEDSDIIILGYLIDTRRRRLNCSPKLRDRESFYASLESYLHACSGRFICIARHGRSMRLYPDASGSLGVLFSVKHETAGSTIHLFPREGTQDDENELIENLNVAHNNTAFLLGFTPRKSISRLMPNHFLDLGSWTSKRFWPNSTLQRVANPYAEIGEVAKLLKASIEAVIAAGHRPWMSLTSGYDSRALLAVAKPFAKQIRWFTWELPDKVGQQDVTSATELADKHNLDHTVFPFLESETYKQQLWLMRAGLSVGENRGKKLVSTVESMGEDTFYMPGLAAEVGWGKYLKQSSVDTSRPTSLAEQLLGLYSKFRSDQLLQACEEWLNTIPNQSRYNLLSLFYLEQRLGCWAGVTAYGHAKGPLRIHPYSNRRIFEILLGLPIKLRSDKAFLVQIIQRNWSELLDLPFA